MMVRASQTQVEWARLSHDMTEMPPGAGSMVRRVPLSPSKSSATLNPISLKLRNQFVTGPSDGG